MALYSIDRPHDDHRPQVGRTNLGKAPNGSSVYGTTLRCSCGWKPTRNARVVNEPPSSSRGKARANEEYRRHLQETVGTDEVQRVWSGNFDGSNQAIVSAPTQAQAIKMLGPGTSAHRFRDFYNETGNSGVLAFMADKPNSFYLGPIDSRDLSQFERQDAEANIARAEADAERRAEWRERIEARRQDREERGAKLDEEEKAAEEVADLLRFAGSEIGIDLKAGSHRCEGGVIDHEAAGALARFLIDRFAGV